MSDPTGEKPRKTFIIERQIDRDWVALTLAVGLATALNVIVLGVMIDAIRSAEAVLSENATQVLTGWGGGVIGILGAVFGYKAGSSQNQPSQPDTLSVESITPMPYEGSGSDRVD